MQDLIGVSEILSFLRSNASKEAKNFIVFTGIKNFIKFNRNKDSRYRKSIMENIEIYTIGVYGSTADLFFLKLKENKIDTFCDIRRRRGVRGSEYSFVNSRKLQDRLQVLKISYLHIIELSTPEEIRKIQYDADKNRKVTQRKRLTLSDNFINAYKNRVLEQFDFKSLFDRFIALESKKVVLFCVEENPLACHRSIVAGHLMDNYGFRVTNL